MREGEPGRWAVLGCGLLGLVVKRGLESCPLWARLGAGI